MIKRLDDSGFDGDSSNSSVFSAEKDDSLIDIKIIEEEERLQVENKKSEMEEVAKFESEALKRDVTHDSMTEEELIKQRGDEIKEMRFRRLMHLLNNSKMYSVILKSRIQEDEAKARAQSNLQRKKSSTQIKKKSQPSYKIGNIITEQNIDESTSIENNVEQLNDEEDYFKETRTTSLGFKVSSQQPILLEGGVMRDYQLKGLNWLKVLFMNGVNGILADEMGLGKTIQVISFICHMIENDIKGPFLIVAPLTTLNNWMLEFKKFAPKVPVLIYHGAEQQRKNLFPKIFEFYKVLNKTVNSVIITSYQVPLRDKKILSQINWYYLIIDEGHRIKNQNSQLARTLREFTTIGRLLLTGTPLQNDLSELWCLLNFLLPEIFDSLDVFESWFDIKELESNGTQFMKEKLNIDVVSILQEILVPFLLRREKKDVNLQLPPKKEILIYCPLAPHQKKLYQATLDQSIEFFLKLKENVDVNEPLPKRKCFLYSPYGKKKFDTSADGKKEKILDKKETDISKKNILTKKKYNNFLVEEKKEEEKYSVNLILRNSQMHFRKIVNHPYLIQFPLLPGTEEYRIDEDLVKESGKLLVLDAILAKLKERGHKVVIFSCFTMVLDILEEYATMRGYNYCRLDGKMNMEERNEEINKFMTDENIFLFFVSIRAGGLGINLTAADTVIFFDSDWNPQMNLQSEDRCHRIGQTKPVVIYRLCCKGTIDESIIERANAKRRLEKMVLQKGMYALSSKAPKNLNLMNLQELKTLLESTNHDAVMKPNGYVLSEEELEALLDRSEMTKEKISENGNDNKIFTVLNYENS